MTRRAILKILPQGPAYAGVPGSTAVLVEMAPWYDLIGMHRHHHVDQLTVVLSGEMSFREEGDAGWRVLRRGQSRFFPRGTAHHLLSRSNRSARALVVLSPGSVPTLYFAELLQAIEASDPPDRDWIVEIMRRHDTELLPDGLVQPV